MDRDERNRYIQNDERYKQMLKAFCILEKQFDNTVGALPLEIQDIIWDYVLASNAQDEYALMIAGRLLDHR